MDIQYIDRKTKKIEREKIYGYRFLSLLYGETLAARIFSLIFLPLFSRISWISRWYGYLQKRPSSRHKIQPFISEFQIDPSEFQTENFQSFNDFFIRKLKAETRPIIPEANRAALPADGRYLVFPDLQKAKGFYIKGQTFDLASFLQDAPLAKRLSNGAMAVARLCPTDYHRFHFPCSGTPSIAKPINGPLFSVNPLALRKKLSILSENKRIITEMPTDRFGTIFIVEIGATFVGSIQQTYTPNTLVNKGEEKGFFSFGGSCIVLLFERGTIQFDPDLIQNSERGIETKALFGDSLGTIAD